MSKNKIIDIIKNPDLNGKIQIDGWVRTKRGSKNVSFIALNDGSTIKNIQIVAESDSFSEDLIKK
jgi:asparaginyl-tRNA synthetase